MKLKSVLKNEVKTKMDGIYVKLFNWEFLNYSSLLFIFIINHIHHDHHNNRETKIVISKTVNILFLKFDHNINQIIIKSYIQIDDHPPYITKEIKRTENK